MFAVWDGRLEAALRQLRATPDQVEEMMEIVRRRHAETTESFGDVAQAFYRRLAAGDSVEELLRCNRVTPK